ncbi:MAG: hypothetical protein KGS61_18110, partial [Verrucomicrobia bacterium]|nr:hypothetical protein [Verrucomicrobiota bacterium]
MPRGLNACWILSCLWLSLVVGRTENFILHLKNGDRLTGDVVAETTNEVTVLTPWKVKVTVPVAQIASREKVAAP